MKKIIFVDDTPEVLMVYKRLFSKKEEWQCFFFEDAVAALNHLEYYAVDIIVTDLEMPFFDGVELLKTVKEEYPSIVRIIISGATMTTKHYDVVRLAHRFFRKPTNLKAIYGAIEHTFFVQQMLIGEKAREMLGTIETIPSYPFIIDKIEQEIHSPNGSLKNVGSIISEDPGLTGNILKLINSDYFDFANEIVSPELAVTLIGIEGIEGVIMSQCLLEEFPISLCQTFGIEHFKSHSYITAQFSRIIAQSMHWSDTDIETAFTTGLLHDVGRLVLEVNYTQKSAAICKHLAQCNGNADLSALEQANIGISHAQVAAYILGLWGVKDVVIEAILLHHHPSRFRAPQNPEMAAVLHCADQFASSLFPKFSIDGKEELDTAFLNEYIPLEKVNEWRELCKSFVENSKLRPLKCWEFSDCGRGPNGAKVDELGICPAALPNQDHCWLTEGTLCSKNPDLTKEETCHKCEYYQSYHPETV